MAKAPASVVRGAWAGAVAGVLLSLVLRQVLGPPEHFLLKTLAIIGIVAAFGAFTGRLVAASRADRRTERRDESL